MDKMISALLGAHAIIVWYVVRSDGCETGLLRLTMRLFVLGGHLPAGEEYTLNRLECFSESKWASTGWLQLFVSSEISQLN